MMCMVPLWSNAREAVSAQRTQSSTDCSRVLKSHLPTAELEEYVDVLLVLKIMREFHHMLVRQRSVQLDLVRNLSTYDNWSNRAPISIFLPPPHKKKQPKHRFPVTQDTLQDTQEKQSAVIVYLVPLVWFGHPALWNHFDCIHFVVGQVCHLIASSKAALGRNRQ